MKIINRKNSGGSGGDMTPEEIKIAYESNPNTNAFTDAEKSKLALAISNVLEGTNISIDYTDPENPVISSVPGSSVSYVGRFFLTGDEVTLPSGTYYQTSLADKGTVPLASQVISINDNEEAFFAQDSIGVGRPEDFLIVAGTYTADLSVEHSVSAANIKYTYELYATDADGNLVDSGIPNTPIGDLGVTPIVILTSGITEKPSGDVGSVTTTGILTQAYNLPAFYRVLHHIGAEKVNTAGGNTNITLYFGQDANSYIDSNAPINSDNVVNESNVFGATVTDALNALDNASTPTAPEIKALYESNPNTNAFTDAEKTKLSNLDNLTDAQIKQKYENNADTNAFTDAEKDKLENINLSDVDKPGDFRTTREDLSSQKYYNMSLGDVTVHKDVEPIIFAQYVEISTNYIEQNGTILANSYIPYELAEGVYMIMKFSDKKMYIFTDFENRTDETLYDTSAFVANIDHNDFLGSVNEDRFFIRDADNDRITMITFDKNAGDAAAIIATMSSSEFDTTGLVSNYQYITTKGIYLGSDWSNIAYQAFDSWTNPANVSFEDWSAYLNYNQNINYRIITPNGFYFSQGFVVNPITGQAKEIRDFTCNSNFCVWHMDGWDYFSLEDTVGRVNANFDLEILPLNGFMTGAGNFVQHYYNADNYFWANGYVAIRNYVEEGVQFDYGVNRYITSLGTSSQPKKRTQTMCRYNNRVLSAESTNMKSSGYFTTNPSTVTIKQELATGDDKYVWMKGEFKNV